MFELLKKNGHARKEVVLLFLACIGLGAYIGRVLRELWGTPNVLALIFALAIFTLLLFKGLHRERRPPQKKSWLILGGITSALLMLYCYFLDAFGSVDIQAIAFHLTQDLQAKDDDFLQQLFYKYLFCWLAFIWAIYFLCNYDLRLGSVDRFALAFCLLINPLWLQAYEYVQTDEALRLFLAENYQEPQDIHLADSAKKNLVIFYLESMERTFLEPVFGDIYEDVFELEKSALSFTNISQTEATGWTIAGMVGSQCGVPLLPYGLYNRNNLGVTEEFLPSVECLGDVLDRAGYHNAYIGGADLGFAGKGNFYKDHGFQYRLGTQELQAKYPNTPVHRWGFADDVVMDEVLLAWAEAHSKGTPYSLISLTTGAHAPDGFPAPECEQKWPERYRLKIELGIKCSGYLAARTIQKAQEQGLLENTVVVVMSDHLMMKSGLTPQLETLPRKILFMAIGDGIKPETIAREGSTWDIYPTLLHLIGAESKSDKIGLGVSLLSDSKNLIEQYGLDHINTAVRIDSLLRERIWSNKEEFDEQ